MPAPDLLPSPPHRATPYLYDEQQIAALLAAAGTLRTPPAALAVETARQGLDQAHIDDALQAASALPAWPDAREALERLDGAGLRLAVLTNSGADAGRSTLEQAGLLDLFELLVGVDEVETFKPDERTYAHAVSELGVRAGEVLLVVAHGWDVTGAGAAGLRTAWIARGEVVLAPTVPEPDLQVADLAALADAVLALADGPWEPG